MESKNLSTEDVQHILKTNRCKIVDAINMNIAPILDSLIEDDIISPEVCARITAEQIPHDSARKLWHHVYSNGSKVYLSFKKGLKKTKCDDLLEALEAKEADITTTVKMRHRSFTSYPEPTVSSSQPEQTTTKQPLWKTKLLDPNSSSKVKRLTSFFESPAAKQDCPERRKLACNSEHCRTSKHDTNVSESPMFSKGFAGSRVHMDSRDNRPEQTTLKQMTESLNNVGIHAKISNSNVHHRSINMLLVGCKENGKSSTGNSILGEKCFMSKRRGGTSKASLGSASFPGQSKNVVWDVKVVDTPGISHEMTKSEFTEVVSGVKMLSEVCSRNPGKSPGKLGIDAIVLIWSYERTDSNVERECQAFQSLHRLFGDGLFKYLVIAVRHTRRLISMEDYVEELPAPLREIERKCSGRLVTFESDTSNLKEIQDSREELCNIVYSLSNRNHHRYTVVDLSTKCTISEGSELRVALIGKTGVGKSSTGNSIIGCEKFAFSCSASSETFGCPYYTRMKPRKVAVVDSPGVLCTDSGVCDKDRLVDHLSSIAAIYNTNGLHAMLLVISGRQRFTQEDKDTVQYLRTVFGDTLLQDYTIIVITGKDEIEADEKIRGDVETYLRNAPAGLQEVLKLCDERIVFFNNKTKDETIQRMQLVELIRMIDDLVERNGGPYIDENFEEGKAVAADIEARSKQNHPLSSKAKSTSQLAVASSSLASIPFPDEKQHLPISTRAKSISGFPTRSISSTSFFFQDHSCFSEEGIGLPGMITDDETFTTDELVSVRNKTPVSVAEDQSRASYKWQSQKSLEDLDRRASASPLSPRDTGEKLLRHNEDSYSIEVGEREERVRRFTALSNLRWTKLWRAIRKKLRFGSRKRYTVTVTPSTKEGWT